MAPVAGWRRPCRTCRRPTCSGSSPSSDRTTFHAGQLRLPGARHLLRIGLLGSVSPGCLRIFQIGRQKKNKAREKRLAKDKKVLKEFIENIYLSNKTSVFLSEDETIVFFDGIVLKKLHLLISELLTDLNNL